MVYPRVSKVLIITIIIIIIIIIIITIIQLSGINNWVKDGVEKTAGLIRGIWDI